jgi:hypothetical protein
MTNIFQYAKLNNTICSSRKYIFKSSVVYKKRMQIYFDNVKQERMKRFTSNTHLIKEKCFFFVSSFEIVVFEKKTKNTICCSELSKLIMQSLVMSMKRRFIFCKQGKT